MNSFNFKIPKVRWFDFTSDPEKFIKSSDILLFQVLEKGLECNNEAASCAVPAIRLTFMV